MGVQRRTRLDIEGEGAEGGRDMGYLGFEETGHGVFYYDKTCSRALLWEENVMGAPGAF